MLLKSVTAKISATWNGCVAGENGGSFCQTYRIITSAGTTTVSSHGETMLNTDGTSRYTTFTVARQLVLFCSSTVLLLLAVAQAVLTVVVLAAQCSGLLMPSCS
jgi:hypothetical protein